MIKLSSNSNNTNNNNKNITKNTPSTDKKLDTLNKQVQEVKSDVKVMMKDIIARSSAAKQATQPSTMDTQQCRVCYKDY